MLIFTIGFEIKNAKIKKLFQILVTALVLPILFSFYQFLKGQTDLILNPLNRLQAFLNLFLNPFIDRFPHIPWYYDLTYGIRYWLPILATIATIIFLFKTKESKLNPYKVWLVGLILSIFLVSTIFVFNGIIGHEQQEFALRLLQCFYVSSLPILAILIFRPKSKLEKPYLQFTVLAFFSFLLTISWYFSYPQYNIKYPFFAPSVSAVDIYTVNYMHERAGGEPYIVLSNQMTSAAALQELGFLMYHTIEGEEVLWYALPTGGDLYQRFTRVLAEPENADEILNYISEQTGVKRIYIVLHMYWPWDIDVLKNLNQGSNTELHINNEIYLFEYIYED